MKVVIDESLRGKDLFNYLVENKSMLIAKKKTGVNEADAVSYCPEFYAVGEQAITKTAIESIPDDATRLRAKIVANSANWFDSQKDVLLPDSWKKTIKDGNGRLHLKDHTYSMDAEVGDVVNIYSQNISLTELGINKTGTTQALIYESDVQRNYDAKTFDKYRKGKVNQHSIGLQYVKIFLAVNDKDYKEEYAIWNQYIEQVINKEDAINAGFMWIVPEIKLIEVSAVLLGANKLTPTLTISESTKQQPELSTANLPQPFDMMKYISETNFIN